MPVSWQGWALIIGYVLLIVLGVLLASWEEDVWLTVFLILIVPVTAVLLVLIPLGNTSFLGFPLIEALLGAGQQGFVGNWFGLLLSGVEVQRFFISSCLVIQLFLHYSLQALRALPLLHQVLLFNVFK